MDALQAPQLRFLYNASIRYLVDNPPLSHFYMTKLNHILIDANVELPLSIKQRFCAYCFNLFLPGENCDVRVKPLWKCSSKLQSLISRVQKEGTAATKPKNPLSKKIKKHKHKKKDKNVVCYHCRACDRITPFRGTTPEFMAQLEKRKPLPPITILPITKKNKKQQQPQQQPSQQPQQAVPPPQHTEELQRLQAQLQPQQPQQQPQPQQIAPPQQRSPQQPQRPQQPKQPPIQVHSIVSDQPLSKQAPKHKQQQPQQPQQQQQGQQQGQQQKKQKGKPQQQQQPQPPQGTKKKKNKNKNKNKKGGKTTHDALRSILQSATDQGDSAKGGGLDLFSFLQSINKK